MTNYQLNTKTFISNTIDIVLDSTMKIDQTYSHLSDTNKKPKL